MNEDFNDEQYDAFEQLANPEEVQTPAPTQAGINRNLIAIGHRNNLRQLQNIMPQINNAIPQIIFQLRNGNQIPAQQALQRLHYYRDTLARNFNGGAYILDENGARLLYDNIIQTIRHIETGGDE
jgi:hypothetical protein